MLAQKLILSYSTKIVLQFIQIAASIVVARIAGPTVLGTLAFGLAYVSMFAFISSLGFDTAHIKLISEGKNLENCIATFSVLKFFTIGLYLLTTLSFFLIQKFIFHVQFESLNHQYVILIFLIMMTIQFSFSIPNMTFAALTQQAKQDIPQILRTLLLQIFRVTAVILGYRTLTLAFSNLLSNILIIPLIWYLFKDFKIGKFDKGLAKEYVKIAIPMIIYGISISLGKTLDKVLLQFFTNSKEVGYYSAGFRIGGFILLIANSVGILFFPIFSKAIANKEYGVLKSKIEKFERFSLLFVLPTVIFLIIYSDSIVLLILGKKYIPSINVLSIITAAMFILMINTPFGNVLTGLGLFGLTAKIHIINLFIFLMSIMIFVNIHLLNLGATGAALAVLTSNIFLGIMFRYFAKKHLKNIKIKLNHGLFIFNIILLIVFFMLYNFYEIKLGLYFRILFPIIYYLITYTLLIVFKFIKKSDWELFFKLFDFKSMKRYIKSEIIEKKEIENEYKE